MMLTQLEYSQARTPVEEALEGVQGLFDHACTGLAGACSSGGKIDPGLLDRHQVSCYELAFVSAELLAAKNALADAGDAGALDQSLALLYIGEALHSIKTRIEPLLPELGIEYAQFRQSLGSEEVACLIQSLLDSTALDEIGQAVIENHGDVGRVELDQDKSIMRDAFQRLAKDIVMPQAEEIHRHDLTVPEDLLGTYREMGVFGLSVPERFGGTAPDDRDDNLAMIVVTEALSQASLAAAGSLITRPEIMTRALLAGGTEEQKQHWLPKIAVGDPLCGIAITEPDYGSDVANLSLKASRVGGGWLLNGAKAWCTFAGKAGLLLVVARTNPDRSLGYKGLSVMLVEKDSFDSHEFSYTQDGGGKLTGKAIATIGYRGMHSYDLAFEDFFVPDANLLGGEAGEGKGFYFTMAGLTGGRIQTAARASGVMRAALDAAILYSQDRKVFGAPLGSYQLTRAKIARMAARLAACRQLTYAVGRMLDNGEGQMEASLVKLFACRSAELITREALQIHGGMGYAEETPVSRYFVDARVLSIFEGAEETLALKVVAREWLQRALKRG